MPKKQGFQTIEISQGTVFQSTDPQTQDAPGAASPLLLKDSGGGGTHQGPGLLGRLSHCSGGEGGRS